MPAPLAAAAAGLGRAAIQGAARGAMQGASHAERRAAREAAQKGGSGGGRLQNWQKTQGKQNGERLQQRLEQRTQKQGQGGEQDGTDNTQQSQSAVDKMLQRPLAQVLQKMWMACATIKGALLGVPYIHVHLIMHYIGGPLSKFFCAPGEEWNLDSGVGAGADASPLPKLLGYGEIITVLVVDAIIAFLIAALILIIYLITHPVEAAKLGFEVFAQML